MHSFVLTGAVLTLSLTFVLPAAVRADDGASVKGSIKFEGAAPKMKKIKLDAEPTCKAHHEKDTEPMRDESVVVNANHTLRWVIVYVKSGLEGKTFPVPAEAITLDQKGCQYHPHAWGMMAGQKLIVLNSDEGVLHNIHAFSEKSNGFNKGMPGAAGVKLEETFKDVESPVKIKCDVHGWMTSYAFVLPHPFHATTGDQGTFEIKGLPAGEYEIEAWHEKYGTQVQKIKVAAGEAKSLDFTFKSDVPADAASPAQLAH